jgi:hypothetical protein
MRIGAERHSCGPGSDQFGNTDDCSGGGRCVFVGIGGNKKSGKIGDVVDEVDLLTSKSYKAVYFILPQNFLKNHVQVNLGVKGVKA